MDKINEVNRIQEAAKIVSAVAEGIAHLTGRQSEDMGRKLAEAALSFQLVESYLLSIALSRLTTDSLEDAVLDAIQGNTQLC